MASKNIFSPPGSKDKIELKGFKLDSIPIYYVCRIKLETAEMKNEDLSKNETDEEIEAIRGVERNQSSKGGIENEF